MLTLGDIEFSGLELPESMPMGGEQTLAIHRMIGGKRVIDAMGPDDAAIEWSGRFLGQTAELRALQLDLLRRSGREVELAFGLRQYRVAVRRFTAKLERPYLVSYSISCEVIEDLVAGDGGAESQSIEEAVAADIAMAEEAARAQMALLAAVNFVKNTIENPRTALVLVQQMGVGALSVARDAVAGSIGTAVAEATAANLGIAAASGVGAATGAIIGDTLAQQAAGALVEATTPSPSVGGVVAGGEPREMATTFLATADNADKAYAAQMTAASLTRVQANLERVPR